MSDDHLNLSMGLVAKDEASPAIRTVEQSFADLSKQLVRLTGQIKRSFGTELSKSITSAIEAATKFKVEMTSAATDAAKAIKSDVSAANDLTSGLRAAAAEQRRVIDGARTAATVNRSSVRTAAAARARESQDQFRTWRMKWQLRQRSERAEQLSFAGRMRRGRYLLNVRRNSERLEQREQARVAKVAATEATRKIKEQQRAFATKLSQNRYLLRIRERSERDELRHLRTVQRERTALRREMRRTAHETLRHGERAVNSINHPAHESIGRALTVGAAIGTAGAVESVRHDENIDSWLTQYKITTKASLAEIKSVREEALKEANSLGIDPGEIVKLRVQSVRDGLKPELARIMPKLSAMAAQAMGGSIEEDGEELSRAVKDGQVVGWVKDQKSARSMMNNIVGLSTFEGNSPLKMKQALASDLIGRGKELGWTQNETMAAAATLNSSGERTGFGTARLLAQVPMIRAGLFDKWREATKNPESEEHSAMIGAPRTLGYSGIREMEGAFSSPDKLFDLLYRLSKINEKKRSLIEKGFGLDEQFNPIISEAGADHGKKYRDAKAKADQLSAQDESNDELSQAWDATRSSLSNIIGRIKQGWITFSDEVGDTLKTDILEPLASWWGSISDAILDGDLGSKAHNAIQAFIDGLGFKDFAALLKSISDNARGFDLPAFMRGLGQGIRSFVDTIRSVIGLFGGAGGFNAGTVGRLAAELLGLSVALRVISPVLTLIGGVAEGIRAVGAAVKTIGILSGLGAAEGAGGGILAALGAEGAIALAVGTLPLTIAAAIAATVLAVTIVNWPKIKEYLTGSDNANNAKADLGPNAQVKNRILKSVPESLRNDPSTWSKFLSPNEMKQLQLGPEMPEPGLLDRFKGVFQRTSYEGGEDPDNWRNLLTKASYEPSDQSNRAKQATIATREGVYEVKAAIERLTDVVRIGSGFGSGSGGGEGSGGGGFGGGAYGSSPNIRYGRQHMGFGGSVGAGPGDQGGRASAMKGDVAARANKAMAKLMSLGWSKEAAAAAIGNAQQESGVRSDGPLGDTKRFGFGDDAAHGMFQWRGQRFRDLKAFAGARGKSWQDFDTQLEFFDQESKKYGSGSWRKSNSVYEANVGMKRFEGYGDDSFGTRLANARQIAAGRTDGGYYASQGETSGGGSVGGGDAVGIAQKLMGAGSGQASKALHHVMTAGLWCADFVNGAIEAAGGKGTGSSMADSFRNWGKGVSIQDAKRGDVIMENSGPGTRVHHAGMVESVDRDKNGKVTGIHMISGNYGHKVSRNLEPFNIIAGLRRGNTGAAHIAPNVPTADNPSPKTGRGRNTSATNTMNPVINVHGVSDPHKAAQLVAQHLAKMNEKYHDTMPTVS